MKYIKLLSKVNAHIGTIQSGEIFVVRDLFHGTEWNELQRGEKLGFGRFFKQAVMNGSVQTVEYIGKADNNSAQYRKK